MVPMGSVLDTYGPMQLSKSAGETPKKYPESQNPQPFWTRPPSPLTMRGRVGGRRPRALAPRRLYILYLQTGDFPPHQNFDLSREKTWGEVVHRLVETSKCSAKASNPPCLFHVGKWFFRGEDFTAQGQNSHCSRIAVALQSHCCRIAVALQSHDRRIRHRPGPWPGPVADPTEIFLHARKKLFCAFFRMGSEDGFFFGWKNFHTRCRARAQA